MAIKIWVGKRESDVLTYNYFDISITFWGSNLNNNHSFCTTNRIKSNYNEDFTSYVLKLLLKYISSNSNVEIHFYSNIFAYKLINLEPILEKYIVNINCKRILDITRHKTLSRVWLQNTIDVPCFASLSKRECQYEHLTYKFPSYNKFIIQKNISGGGEGTYIIDKNNYNEILSFLSTNDVYLVSPYYEKNISLSCHILIDDKNITVFPISEQLLNYNNNKISYCGNKYLTTNSDLSIKIKNKATEIGYKLMNINYRGICGLDFIFTKNKVFLIEINPRYQGSSYLINAMLKKYHLPSLFELNSTCFNENKINNDIISQIKKMQINLESHTVFYNNRPFNYKSIFSEKVTLYLDGLPNANDYEKGVYLYRYIKKQS